MPKIDYLKGLINMWGAIVLILFVALMLVSELNWAVNLLIALISGVLIEDLYFYFKNRKKDKKN